MPNLPKKEDRRVYIGIDPGKSGGLAACAWDGKIVAVKMPATERDVWDWFVQIRGVDCFAVIEKVGGYMPGGRGNIGSAMFNFGASYGGLRMALIAAGIPFEAITPGVWQRALGISPRKKTESKGAWKNRLKAKAQQLFPKLNVTLATADALLIAEYAKRKSTGTL